MPDPTLKRTSVQINYTASDGYRSEVGYSNARGCTPESVFIEAVDELSRLCHLFGFGDRARAAFDESARRVNKWRGVAHPPTPVDAAASTDGGSHA
jgi:hypothetical protein